LTNQTKIIDEKVKQREKNLKKLKEKKLEFEKNKQEITALENQHNKDSEELNIIVDKTEPLNQELDGIQMEIATQQAQYKDLMNEKNELQKLIKEGKIKYDKAVEKVLKARDSGRIQGILGTLIELIEEVDTQFVDIVESVVGQDKLQALIVEDEYLNDIIEFIHKENIPRLVLFPLQSLNGNERTQSIPEEAKDYKMVKDLIKFKKGYEDLKEKVFQDILVIEDLSTALSFSDFGAITLEKDLILNGAVTSGYMDSRFLTTKYNKEKLDKLEQELLEKENGLKKIKNKANARKKKRCP